MGTQESSTEGVPRRGAEIGGDGHGTAEDHAGRESQTGQKTQPGEKSQPGDRPQQGERPELGEDQHNGGDSQASEMEATPGVADSASRRPGAERPRPDEPAQPEESVKPDDSAQPEDPVQPDDSAQPEDPVQPDDSAHPEDSVPEHSESPRQPGEPIEAHFANPRRQKPQRYNRGHSKVHPTTPLDPITPYMAGPVPRRRKSDWPILLFAMVVAATVMATCCIAGFAIFRTYGLSF
jgi:hypothetical protein